jgi:hypothetical protein
MSLSRDIKVTRASIWVRHDGAPGQHRDLRRLRREPKVIECCYATCIMIQKRIAGSRKRMLGARFRLRKRMKLSAIGDRAARIVSSRDLDRPSLAAAVLN